MTILEAAPLDVLDAYRTCEFVTLGRDGAPLVWPTASLRQKDGTLLVTTSLAFAQKALNVRRDGRVALLFSDPTGSGLPHAQQIFVGGHAECGDDIMTGTQGAEDYWRMLFDRQPHSRSYVSFPMRRLMSWYYLRLLITVTPEQVIVRPPLEPPASPPPAVSGTPLGHARLAEFPSAVLAALDCAGAPLLARTVPKATEDGYLVDVPADCAVTPGQASLLVHRHDELLNNMTNTLVRGQLRKAGESWELIPAKVVEPMGSGRLKDAVQVLRQTRRDSDRYLERRGLARPDVRWDEFKALATAARKGASA
ncbi:pyridoxamine 5'-phosphate oxidase family protein [Streptomyces sp. NPDC046909]|uniref:pyridoxamine 5'-phosphate oxidase family protein n=1 Tax=Streptomyces sp. NPDC046909 TaxID=3155617 RepID=UPI0033DF3F09